MNEILNPFPYATKDKQTMTIQNEKSNQIFYKLYILLPPQQQNCWGDTFLAVQE